MTAPNTLFLRLEGPLQAWGRDSKFVIRRTAKAPTKSGVLGMICCAMGIKRAEARGVLERLNTLAMGLRCDRAGTLWSDYHTVGAKVGILKADGTGVKRTKPSNELETLLTRRYYLCDASFLVGLQGEPELISDVRRALTDPRWPVYLGRRSCPPAVPVVADDDAKALGTFPDLISALASREWHPRVKGDPQPANGELSCLIEWRAASDGDIAPDDAEVWHDVPLSFAPPVHGPRLVERIALPVNAGQPLQKTTPRSTRPRADYSNAEYKKRRRERLAADHDLCILCKARATTVQHVTYRRAGGSEEQEDLRSLCRLCHDAVSMIEYGLNMGLDRINPEEPRWREKIIAKREEIIRLRSTETRRRQLRRGMDPEEAE